MLLGGQAVNVWAEAYHHQDSELQKFAPFMSRHARHQTGFRFCFPEVLHTSPVPAVQIFVRHRLGR